MLPVILSSCSVNHTGDREGLEPVYLVRHTSHEPFWFELVPGGPQLIPSPAESSIDPFVPWSHGLYIQGFLPIDESQEEVFYAAVNRGGLLEWRNSGEETAIYYYSGGEVWERYPLAAFFCYSQKPSVLFTRDRFFSFEEQNVPEFALWSLGSLPQIPALKPPNAPKDREVSGLILGRDGRWYFRAATEIDNGYFQTTDLDQPGMGISGDAYLAASRPLEINSPNVPPLLAWIIAEAARLAEGPCIVTVVSPEFPAKRIFCSAEAEFSQEVFGYYRPSMSGRDAFAVILFPDGRGIYGCSTNAKDGVRDGHFRLPALPAGGAEPGSSHGGIFAYTGIVLAGERTVIAAWEEQEEWNLGAAGFLLLAINWN